jgi:hypothetical protein
MPNYDISKPSDLRRWARDTARDIEKELNRELRRHPIRVPIEPQQMRGVGPWHPTHQSALGEAFSGSPGGVTFNVQGDGIQLAVGNAEEVHQSIIQGMGEADLAELIRQLRAATPALELDQEDAAEFEVAVSKVEQESAKSEPNKGRLRRALATISDFLKNNGAEIAKTLAPLVAAAVQSLQSSK